MLLRAVAVLQLLAMTAAPEAPMTGLGAALLDSDFMPPSLLMQSDPAPRPQAPTINNASVSIALSTMGFHRRMMNEYLCRGYMAEDILERLQRNAEDTTWQRGPDTTGRHKDSLRARVLLTDQGSSNYRSWLERSAVLEDIYRHFEHDGRGESDVELPVESRGADDEDEDSSSQKGKSSVKGQRASKPRPAATKEKGRRPSSTTTALEDSATAGQHTRDEYLEFPPHDVAEGGWTGLGFGMEDLYDITLTAVAFLAFGIFILNVFLGIVTQKTGTQTVMVANSGNSSLPVRIRRGSMEFMDSPTHERIARWAEELPESFQELPEEAVGRLALLSLNVAIRAKPAHCLQSALCRANQESRGLEGQAKYWLPMWSLGMSWLARRGGSEAGTSALFSGALENLSAATLGLAGVRCHVLFPPC